MDVLSFSLRRLVKHTALFVFRLCDNLYTRHFALTCISLAFDFLLCSYSHRVVFGVQDHVSYDVKIH
jgi:hypothetical protein